ncbi:MULTISPECIES: hypothetical protein [Rhizobium]|uniref:Uncharacterized protein n=1 Tax=Rhizobium phaseoli TaxID=396 RepID=A0A7X6IVZ9_9HYPH|nr:MULTISPECIES: hypothetical protein [Rhizobium]ANL50287.1 hypothetical protein AMC87_PD00160 [Rhizobium phaseoli]ARM15826.1 hypothetical protein Bra5_PD00282 [Rhizobium phaseoli Brasil 5]MDE8757859.1 hypothetical protein [Rhizobium sp. CBK13]NKF09476.1 hypothetical protein [Rhizobium phaseoli]QPK12845.1 hypothetical protein HER27_028130 [Rhizobium phaseoli]
MSYLVKVLLPVGNDAGSILEPISHKLTEIFGGVTMHVNAPAEGLWKNEGDVDWDRIVVVEVMTNNLDRAWWAAFRKELELALEQEEIVIRASEVERL